MRPGARGGPRRGTPGGRVLGIIGGVGPESTLDYLRRLVDGWHDRRGGGTHPELLVAMVDGGVLIGPLAAGDTTSTRVAFEVAAARLAAGGAGLGLIASVAGHVVFDEVAASAGIPLLSIIEATLRATVASGVRRPAVFGTLIATEGAYFARPFEASGIELVLPSPEDRRWIHVIYVDELLRGIVLPETRDRLALILRQLRDTESADGLILAGTELSLILPDATCEGLPVLNAAAIHVEAALDWLEA